ncbi:hypothetical protein EG68_08639 [Paragonimus skrjabini miyazakii]|uniref:Nuclear export mediator factor NEMF n=1 Tax=Paragonimus skrjabini miyazakii TaxID=59628 RepID=A0A8S9YJR9_9TREM|nr:hypothetical protein EG68_08639 [Paragonimus skrjabini miyazakii]
MSTISVIGSRVNNIYDVNNKTYLLKLARNEEKIIVLIESGARIHLTEFEWVKNVMPSGFAMKLRKHIRNRKVVCINQLGMDRIVDIQFGFDDTAFHLIAELYDRGNMLLTDHTYTILHLLRPRTDANQDVRYAAHEKYPIDLVRKVPSFLQDIRKVDSLESIRDHVMSILVNTKGPWSSSNTDQTKQSVQKALSIELGYGQALIEHCCRLSNRGVQHLVSSWKSAKTEDTGGATEDSVQSSADCVHRMMLEYAGHFVSALKKVLGNVLSHGLDGNEVPAHGYIFGKKHQPEDTELLSQEDFQPFLFDQYQTKAWVSFSTFSKAVDAYFSKIESHKTTELLAQNEKKANKKFENIKRDHELRLAALKAEQKLDVLKAQLIEANRQLVDSIILMINHALSNQLDWRQLESMVEEARERGDPLAEHIVQLNLQFSQITIRLSDPFDHFSDAVEDEMLTPSDDGEHHTAGKKSVDVVVELDLNALNNARKYYDKRRAAMKKEEKTVVASHKALKSAALKAQQTRKDVKTIVQISKVRKPMWFEKFYWFISSENYLVVAGRDAQQNEALVKRYLGPNDIYVHADLHGASSVIIKTRPLVADELKSDSVDDESTRLPLPPPKTLNEAGTMAITLSSAWNARVVTSAWWVRSDQVSKTAPTGEYLTTGAFMIRGRKNYLPPCHFLYGFGILFKLDDESVARHKGERRVTHVNASYPSLPSNPGEVQGAVQPSLSDEEIAEKGDAIFPNAQLQLNLLKPTDKTVQNQLQTETIAYSRGKVPSVRVSKQVDRKNVEKFSHVENASKETTKAGPLRRGQKSKINKIKQKYGEQDEEERLIRMKLLQGEGAKLSRYHKLIDRSLLLESEEPTETSCQHANDISESEDRNADDDAEQSDAENSNLPSVQPSTAIVNPEQMSHSSKTSDVDEDDPDVGDDAAQHVTEDDWIRLMDTLTGQPVDGDVLLYALPVCAPYSALMNYKFKVKLTPGTAKRGKAAKMSMNYFVMDKSASAREKELLRVMKGEDISRNFPGCVKVSLPQGNTHRNK